MCILYRSIPHSISRKQVLPGFAPALHLRINDLNDVLSICLSYKEYG